MQKPDYQIIFFATKSEFEEWLKTNLDTEKGIWLKFAKKDSGIESVNRQEALEVVLCYGWIDGQSKGLDESFYLQKYTPRGKRSIWSKRNCEIVERLIAEKKVHPSGMVKIEEAKQDGRWDRAYDSPKNMQLPEDFLNALKKEKTAYSFFLTLNKTNTYAIGWKLQTAKKEETRQKRMREIIEMLGKQEKFQ